MLFLHVSALHANRIHKTLQASSQSKVQDCVDLLSTPVMERPALSFWPLHQEKEPVKWLAVHRDIADRRSRGVATASEADPGLAKEKIGDSLSFRCRSALRLRQRRHSRIRLCSVDWRTGWYLQLHLCRCSCLTFDLQSRRCRKKATSAAKCFSVGCCQSPVRRKHCVALFVC